MCHINAVSGKRLCIDIDNVLAQTDEVMRTIISDYSKGRVELSYHDVKEFDYYKCSDSGGNSINKKDWSIVHNMFSEPIYLWRVAPVKDVQKYLSSLSEFYELHLATSRLPKARKTTVEWLEYHGFPSHDLHFLKHGEKHVSLGQFSAAIEDHYEQATGFSNSGTPCYLLKHPWNISKPESKGVFFMNGWSDIVSQLVKLAK